MTKTLENLYNSHEDEMLEDFYHFLRFQSISAKEEHKTDIALCAEWVKEYLKNSGLEVQLWPTANHPTVFASHCQAGEDKPTVLLYTHYDVQPIDPIDEWHTPPFEPTLKEGEIYARGSHDDKGQCMYVMQAIRLLLERDGTLPVNLKLIVEGGEEIGSIGLAGILKDHEEELKSDYLIIVDLSIPAPDVPAITLGVRGMVAFDVEIEGPKGDLHSGQHGGVVNNPLHALVSLLASLHNEDGSVAIDGFYDDVKALSPEETESLNLSFDEKTYIEQVGVAPYGVEEGFSPQESGWARPTLEINGITGGYRGGGFKTVIPAKASAKVSCRLVPNQHPRAIGELVKNHLEAKAPKGTKVTASIHGGMGEAYRAGPDSPAAQAAAEAFSEVFGKPCQYILSGGSIPVAVELAKASQADMVMMGVGLPDDNVHAPNEHFGQDRLKKGALVMAKTLEKLGI